MSLASPDPDPVCYHCWQCAEKYLKAYLTEGDVKFPRTHDLLELQALSLSLDADFEVLTKDLYLIVDYSVDVRYPGRTPTLDEAQAARTSLMRVRVFMRRKLGFDKTSP